MRMTPEDIEVRVWAFVVTCITIMVFVIGVGLMYMVCLLYTSDAADE